MTAINDLIEDWIQIRSTLQRQIRLLEADKLQTGTRMLGDNTDEIVRHLKSWVSDLNKLLKEQSSASRA